MKIIDKVSSPEDLKYLNLDELNILAHEIRMKIVDVVSKNGGHLSSNLGAIEATISMLKTFGDKNDSIIFDVGHQCYAYKILTGRKNDIYSIRKKNGLSGFTSWEESEYDKFKSGHSGTSISLALGLAEFKQNFGLTGKVVVFIGDGSMTCGLSYEGLNNSCELKNLVIILNDNSMSISKNVGAIAKYLSVIRTNDTYLNTKKVTKQFLTHVPLLGNRIKNICSKLNFGLRSLVLKEGSLFENLGFKYYGPIDGHNIAEMARIFSIAKGCEQPVLVHIVTKKGKGYRLAEESPAKFHGISAFNVRTGTSNREKSRGFSDVFGELMCEYAANNTKIYAITAAMEDGTGLNGFAKRFPKQYKDVGISESHAVTFAAGLSSAGYIPIFAVYSTFFQRCFDQIIHDVSMQKLKVILAIDRAGFVGEDGESHQGIFDVSMLNVVPNMACYSPSFFCELRKCLTNAIISDFSVAIRYPKGPELFKPKWFDSSIYYDFSFYGNNDNLLLVTYGRIFSFAAQLLDKHPNDFNILKINKIIPLNKEIFEKSCKFKRILFFEESYYSGSISEKFASELMKNGYNGVFKSVTINGFVKQSSVEEQLHDCHLDLSGMEEELSHML